MKVQENIYKKTVNWKLLERFLTSYPLVVVTKYRYRLPLFKYLFLYLRLSMLINTTSKKILLMKLSSRIIIIITLIYSNVDRQINYEFYLVPWFRNEFYFTMVP